MIKSWNFPFNIKGVNNVPSIELTEGDNNSYRLNINLVDGLPPINLTDQTVRLVLKKSDTKVVWKNFDILDAVSGKVSILLSGQAITYIGNVDAQIKIYGLNNEVITSTKFALKVTGDLLNESDVLSSNEFASLTTVLSDIAKAKETVGLIGLLHSQIQTDITSGNELDLILKDDISSGNTLKTVLEADISTGNDLDVVLKADIDTGNNLDMELKDDISKGDPLDLKLKEDIETGNALDIKLKASTTAGNTTDTNVKASIAIGNTTDDALKADIVLAKANSFAAEVTTARGTKANLDARLKDHESSLAAMANQTNKINYMDYRYISTTFDYNTMKLVVMFSDDGIDWKILNALGSYAPSTETLRDPSILKIGDIFYIIHTKIDWRNGNYIGLVTTKDFITYTQMPDVVLGTFDKIWAPEFFKDDDGKIYIVFTGCKDAIYRPWIVEVTNNFTTFSLATMLSGTTMYAGNLIDFHIKKYNGLYYIAYKQEDAKYIEIMKSTDLKTNYVGYRYGDFAGFGAGLEGPFLIKIDSGWRIYVQNFTTFVMYYSECSNDFNNWSVLKPINTQGFIASHLSILDRYKENFCITDSSIPALIPFCKASSNVNKIIDNMTMTSLPLNTSVSDTTGMHNITTNNSRVTIKTIGIYIICAMVSFTPNITGRRILQINKNGVPIGAVSQRALDSASASANMSLTVINNLIINDYIEIVVYQDCGQSIDVTGNNMDSPLLSIIKIG